MVKVKCDAQEKSMIARPTENEIPLGQTFALHFEFAIYACNHPLLACNVSYETHCIIEISPTIVSEVRK